MWCFVPEVTFRTRTRTQSQVNPILLSLNVNLRSESGFEFAFTSLFCDWSFQRGRSPGGPIRGSIWASASCPSPAWVHMPHEDWPQTPGTPDYRCFCLCKCICRCFCRFFVDVWEVSAAFLDVFSMCFFKCFRCFNRCSRCFCRC